MKKPVYLLCTLLTLTVALGQPAPNPQALDGVDAREAMRLANAWGGQVRSYVTPDAVHFAFPERTVQVPLREQMVVAIAPYVEQTHPCKTHYMSSCRGELAGVPVKVVARASDGRILFGGTVKTLPNGFFELWLPRNLEVSLTLEAQGKRAQGSIATFSNSDTCVTTLRLR